MATLNPENVKLGPCNVSWDGVALGYTKGGVDVQITTSKRKVTVDQFGESEINEYITGRTCTVRVPLAESDLTMLASVLPGAVLITDGADATKKKIEVPTGVGMSLREIAAKLVLHPTHLASGNKLEDFTVPLAAPAGDIEFAFKHDEERIYMVEFVGYPDQEADGLLYVMGDETADPEASPPPAPPGP